MAAGKDFCCRLFRGTLSARLYSSATPNPGALLELGNATSIEITHENTEIEQPNYQSLGGSACKLEYPESANIEITLGCLKARNLALALQGTGSIENIAAATVTDESHMVYEECQVIPFVRIPDATVAIVVTNAAGDTTYVEGIDYEVNAAGITILEGSNIPLSSEILVDYAHGKNTLIEALMSTTSIQELVFIGYDYGEGNPVPIRLNVHKVKFGPTSSWSIIGDEFQTVTISGEILRDDTKPNSVSPFYNLESAEIAS